MMSRYIWRGRDYGNSPSIQPYLQVSYKGFSFGAAGEYMLNGPGWQETDLYVSKSFEYLTLSVYDYYSFVDTLPGNLFEFRQDRTGHLFELMAEVSGFSDWPVSLLASWLFAGYDTDNSLYFELGYHQPLDSGDLDFFVGFTPYKSYYAPRAALVNIGVTFTKGLNFSANYTMPVQLSVVLNPEDKRLYMVAGFTL